MFEPVFENEEVWHSNSDQKRNKINLLGIESLNEATLIAFEKKLKDYITIHFEYTYNFLYVYLKVDFQFWGNFVNGCVKSCKSTTKLLPNYIIAVNIERG